MAYPWQWFRAGRLTSRGVYTPQMVINGTTEFVGSDETRADAAIEAALDARSPISLRLTVVGEGSTARVAFDAPGAPGTSRITAAVFQRGATVDVPRGENQGRQLSHVNVVRALVGGRLSDEGKGELSLELPSDVPRAELGFVGWVSDANTMKITAARSAAMSTTQARVVPGSRDTPRE